AVAERNLLWLTSLRLGSAGGLLGRPLWGELAAVRALLRHRGCSSDALEPLLSVARSSVDVAVVAPVRTRRSAFGPNVVDATKQRPLAMVGRGAGWRLVPRVAATAAALRAGSSL